MTRKHFEAIARAIYRSDLSDTNKMVVASEIASAIAPFNARFEAGRFIRAAMGRGEA